MKPTWLLLDVNNLCHRAFHSIGHRLSFKEAPTGMLYGFFRDLLSLQDRYDPEGIAFCFDHGKPKRKELFAGYKHKRRKATQELDPIQLRAIQTMRLQLEILKTKTLRKVGFRNVFWEDGYEADDIIAQLANNLNDKGSEVVIVSADKDLYQCLNGMTIIHDPLYKRGVVNLDSFLEKYGIDPGKWAVVKAMAGCDSDCIPGIPGVGEKTAIKFLLDQVPETHKVHARILRNKNRVKENIPLVRLPFAGTPVFDLSPDEITKRKWLKFCDQFGFNSLVNWRAR